MSTIQHMQQVLSLGLTAWFFDIWTWNLVFETQINFSYVMLNVHNWASYSWLIVHLYHEKLYLWPQYELKYPFYLGNCMRLVWYVLIASHKCTLFIKDLQLYFFPTQQMHMPPLGHGNWLLCFITSWTITLVPKGKHFIGFTGSIAPCVLRW